MKVISNTYMLAVYMFIAFVAFTHTDSKELEGNYTVESNNNIEDIRTQSNNEWGSISDPSY